LTREVSAANKTTLCEADAAFVEDFFEGVKKFFDIVAVRNAERAGCPVIFESKPHQQSKCFFFQTRKPKILLVQNDHAIFRS